MRRHSSSHYAAASVTTRMNVPVNTSIAKPLHSSHTASVYHRGHKRAYWQNCQNFGLIFKTHTVYCNVYIQVLEKSFKTLDPVAPVQSFNVPKRLDALLTLYLRPVVIRLTTDSTAVWTTMACLFMQIVFSIKKGQKLMLFVGWSRRDMQLNTATVGLQCLQLNPHNLCLLTI